MAPDQAERRLAAIMFTDIVGYTALMGESEDEGLRVWERHSPNVSVGYVGLGDRDALDTKAPATGRRPGPDP